MSLAELAPPHDNTAGRASVRSHRIASAMQIRGMTLSLSLSKPNRVIDAHGWQKHSSRLAFLKEKKYSARICAPNPEPFFSFFFSQWVHDSLKDAIYHSVLNSAKTTLPSLRSPTHPPPIGGPVRTRDARHNWIVPRDENYFFPFLVCAFLLLPPFRAHAILQDVSSVILNSFAT